MPFVPIFKYAEFKDYNIIYGFIPAGNNSQTTWNIELDKVQNNH